MSESVSQSIPFAMVYRWVLAMVGTELTVHDLAVYTAIAARAHGRTRDAFPGIRTIAEDLGVSKSTVQKAVNTLRETGCIDVSKVRRADGSETNHYHLPAERVYRETVQGVPGDGTGGVPPGSTEQETPSNKKQEQETSLAIASQHEPEWVRSARSFPLGSGWTDDGTETDWTPLVTPHQWAHPDGRRRDLLWEACAQSFGPVSNGRVRGRRAKAVALFRESGCDPSEIVVLQRVYRLKFDAPDTDQAVASHVDNLRRWANETTTINPNADRQDLAQELQRRARLKLLEAGPGESDPDSARERGRRLAQGRP